MDRRTAREIDVNSEILDNKQINVKIGTVENRDFPQTIYINISFWIKPKEERWGRVLLEQKLKDVALQLDSVNINNQKTKKDEEHIKNLSHSALQLYVDSVYRANRHK